MNICFDIKSPAVEGQFKNMYRQFATTVSQLKMCDFSGQNFKGFEVLYFSMSATTTQLLSSGEFYKLRYDTIPVIKCICKRFFLYQ
jgi:hypothetical protein